MVGSARRKDVSQGPQQEETAEIKIPGRIFSNHAFGVLMRRSLLANRVLLSLMWDNLKISLVISLDIHFSNRSQSLLIQIWKRKLSCKCCHGLVFSYLSGIYVIPLCEDKENKNGRTLEDPNLVNGCTKHRHKRRRLCDWEFFTI